jgi:hypothetical protein
LVTLFPHHRRRRWQIKEQIDGRAKLPAAAVDALHTQTEGQTEREREREREREWVRERKREM